MWPVWLELNGQGRAWPETKYEMSDGETVGHCADLGFYS